MANDNAAPKALMPQDVVPSSLPLTGLRVVEFCWVWAGPMVGQHLADLGAEVVKVEWYKRHDLYRTRGVERMRGKMPEDVRRESSYSFQSLNRNKLSFTADMKREEGIGLVKDLISESDILIENFTVGTLDRLGLGSQELDRLNEELVVVSLSATGRGSSLEALRSYGLMLSALGGYESLVRDENGDFIGSPTFVMSDPNAALFGVFASLAGALHARETGRGGTYECSQVEAVVSVVDAPEAPQAAGGIYKTSDGEYVALTVDDAPVVVKSLEDLAAWVGQNDAAELLEVVRSSGATACLVHDMAVTETVDEFAGTQVRQPSLHPVSGPVSVVATPWRINGERAPIRKSAPTLGDSNEYVLRSVLSYSEERIAAIHESGVVDEP